MGEVLWPWHRRFGNSTCECRGAGPGEEGREWRGTWDFKAKLPC